MKIIFRSFIIPVIGLVFLLAVSGNANGKKESDKNLEIHLSKSTGKTNFIKIKNSRLQKLTAGDVTLVARQALRDYGKYFALSSADKDLVQIKEETDPLGMKHVKYNQNYKDIPVFGAQLIVHLNADGSTSSINGVTADEINLDTNPAFSKEKAIAKAEEIFAKDTGAKNEEVARAALYILNKGIIEGKSGGNNYLVWLVEIFDAKARERRIYFIDAHDGSLVFQTKVSKNAVNRRVYNYTDFRPVISRSEGEAARNITDVDGLYDILGNAYNYYLSKFSRDGANKLGGLGDGTIERSSITSGYALLGKISDATLNQSCGNAYFDTYAVLFCEGTVTNDIVGHEYSHGVSYYSLLDDTGKPAGFTYSYESGALDEGYADVFGEAVEYYATGASDWISGEGSTLGEYIYSLSDPAGQSDPSYGMSYPDKFSSPNYYCGTDDAGGAHHNSLVISHAAYLMAMGGNFNNYTISGIGRDKEEQIFYRALNYYLTTTSDFNAAYEVLNTSCTDLYGTDSSTCQNAQKALKAVEMDQSGKCAGQVSYTSTTPILYRSDRVWAKTRVDYSLEGLSVIQKKSSISLRLNGRRAKIRRIINQNGSSLVSVNLKYRKWPAGSYTLAMSYKDKSSHKKKSITLKDALIILQQ